MGQPASPDILKKFLTNTDDSGRFIVKSVRTGKTYAVEPIGDPHVKWGSIDPAAGANAPLMHKKGDGKFRGSVDEKDSLITEANGFINVEMLEPGDSPLGRIEQIDAKYPTVNVVPADEVVGAIINA